MNPESVPELSLAASEQIDAICIRYEDHWLSGAQPRLEAFLEEVEETARPTLVYELLRIDLAFGGPQRELVTEEAYLQRLPAYRDMIHVAFRKQRPAPAAAPCRSGEQLGRYRIEKELGRGGFGAVYLATDTELDRQVALKTIRPDLAADEHSQARLRDEARLAATLDDPGIASIYAVETDHRGRPFLVYQLIEGESLRERMRRESLSSDEIAALVAELARAAHYAHGQGVIHCDLQPNNVLLDGNDQPVITDFGLAAHDWIRPAADGVVAGSPPYLAPEQTRGHAEQIDARTDIWALGVILYEGLTGQRPFEGETTEDILHAVQTLTPPDPRSLNASVPESLAKVCMRCLEKSPHDRFGTAADLQRELTGCFETNVGPRFAPLAMLILLLIVPLGAMMLTGSTRSNQPAVWEVETELLVLRDRLWAEAGSPAIPLVADGDRVRFQVQLLRPAYLYVVWIDGEGHATPVHPWPDQDWDKSSAPVAVRQLGLPAGVGKYWRMTVKAEGSESVVVMARDTPLPRHVKLEAAFANLPRQPLIGEVSMVRFQNGLIRPIPAGSRSPVFEPPGESTHGVLETQELLTRRLGRHFPLVHTYTFNVAP